MIKKLFLSFIALFFPWIVFLVYDNPRNALLAFILQATVIGWFPATIWALKTILEEEKHKKS
jgi:hypothetical protein